MRWWSEGDGKLVDQLSGGRYVKHTKVDVSRMVEYGSIIDISSGAVVLCPINGIIRLRGHGRVALKRVQFRIAGCSIAAGSPQLVCKVGPIGPCDGFEHVDEIASKDKIVVNTRARGGSIHLLIKVSHGQEVHLFHNRYFEMFSQ